MTALFLILFALGLVVFFLVLILKLPTTKLNLVLKIFLGMASILILLWLAWLAVMVFGVGPAMRGG